MTRAQSVAQVQQSSGGPVPPQAAGKNAIINGAFNVWQRGTSFALTSAYQYTADRQYALRSSGAGTVSRQSSGLTGLQYCMRVGRAVSDTNTGYFVVNSSLESASCYAFAGQSVTISFYARAGANYSTTGNGLSYYVFSSTGTDQNIGTGFTGQATVMAGTSTLTTTWQRFSYTATVSSSATQLAYWFQNIPTGTAGAADYFEITGIQLEVGSTATPFQTASGTIQGELALCQRYYERITSEVTYGQLSMGKAYDTGTLQLQNYFKVPKRIAPTTLDTSATSTFYWETGATGGNTPTSFSLLAGNTNTSVGAVNVIKAASFVTGSYYFFMGNNNTAAYLGWSAEL